MPIEVKNISCRYGERTSLEVQALEGLSFQVSDGEFVGIMGRTGCGKSTLLQLIAGLLSPGEGQILIDGIDINGIGYDREILRRKLGIVFQYPEYQLFETTVERDVAFSLKHSDLSRDEKAERVRWALEAVGFGPEEAARQSPLSLSGGEKRRVAIAGVLAAKPEILLFDEPIAGLDSVGRQRFLELVAGLHHGGTTILMVSHNAEALCEYADRILVLDRGRLAADGTPEEIFGDLGRAEKQQIGAGDVRRIAQGLYEKGRISAPDIVKYQILLDELKNILKAGEDL